MIFGKSRAAVKSSLYLTIIKTILKFYYFSNLNHVATILHIFPLSAQDFLVPFEKNKERKPHATIITREEL